MQPIWLDSRSNCSHRLYKFGCGSHQIAEIFAFDRFLCGCLRFIWLAQMTRNERLAFDGANVTDVAYMANKHTKSISISVLEAIRLLLTISWPVFFATKIDHLRARAKK